MIHDELVTYEVAKLAREVMLDVPCSHIYTKDGKLKEVYEYKSDDDAINDAYACAPTQSLLQRWLRDNGFGEVEVRHWPETNKYPHHYGWEVKDNLGDLMSFSSKMFDTYEQALEDALKYTLENLF